jgi:hypothetical protein
MDSGWRDFEGVLRNASPVWVFVAAVGFAISAFSLSALSINSLPHYELGLIQVLPATFWLGLFLCLVASFIAMNYSPERIFLATSGLLFILIWTIPVFAAQNPYYGDAYVHSFGAKSIIELGHVPYSYELPALDLSYTRNMPGYFVTLATLVMVGGYDWWPLLKFYPILSCAITFLGAAVFLRKIGGAGYRPALLLIILADVYFEFHVSPQSFGFFIALLVLMTMEHQESAQWRLLSVILFLCLTISHPTSTFLVLGVAALRSIIEMLDRKKSMNLHQETLTTTAIFFVVFIAWLFFNSISYSVLFITNIAARIATTYLLPNTLAVGFSQNVEGAFVLAPRIRLVVLSSFALLCLIYFARRIILRRSLHAGNEARLLAYLAAPVLLAAADVAIGLTWTTLRDRFFLFFLIIASIISVSLIQEKRHERQPVNPVIAVTRNITLLPKVRWRWRHMAAAALLSLAFLNFPTVFYTSGYYIVSDQTIEASKFIDAQGANNTQLLGGYFVPGTLAPSVTKTKNVQTLIRVYPQTLFRSPPYLLILDSFDKFAYYEHYKASYLSADYFDFYEKLAVSQNRVYDSSDYRVYTFLS